ncbi:MAG: hypothetical protein Ct9H90mP14_2900 [Methanobacteriota archaeon]|nr:MAG: hypothetical protein Ct9H90mP14_2900 [Euryarchaeota archaeon]
MCRLPCRGVVSSDAAVPARFTRSQDHHEAYLPLIQWELDDELDATDERLRNWSRAKLAAHGFGSIRFTSPTGWMVIRAADCQTGVRRSGRYGPTQISSGGYRKV